MIKTRRKEKGEKEEIKHKNKSKRGGEKKEKGEWE